MVCASERTAERCQELSQGTRFLRTPGKKTPLNVRTPDGVRGIRDTPAGCVSFFQYTIQVYAKNAYAWLISQHASGVANVYSPINDQRDRNTASKSNTDMAAPRSWNPGTSQGTDARGPD